MPVYEIYKAGHPPSWLPGLNFFKDYGLNPAIIPHWNNNEGGTGYDSSRSYIGKRRFDILRHMLPANTLIIGIDEMTALIFHFRLNLMEITGKGSIILLRGKEELTLKGNNIYNISVLSDLIIRPVSNPKIQLKKAYPDYSLKPIQPINPSALPLDIRGLLNKRQEYRNEGRFNDADMIRKKYWIWVMISGIKETVQKYIRRYNKDTQGRFF